MTENFGDNEPNPTPRNIAPYNSLRRANRPCQRKRARATRPTTYGVPFIENPHESRIIYVPPKPRLPPIKIDIVF